MFLIAMFQVNVFNVNDPGTILETTAEGTQVCMRVCVCVCVCVCVHALMHMLARPHSTSLSFSQFGENFGYSMAAVDLNSDG